jgi:hypothetical protein
VRRDTVEALIDKAEIAELLNGYCYGIDRREWSRYRSIFADPLSVDLAWSGVVTTMPADEWLATVAATLSPFDATLHRMTNPMIELDGDRGTLVCQMTARHMLEIDGISHIHMLGGRYEHSVGRIDGRWLITGLKLVITMEQVDRGLFEAAGALGPQGRADIGTQGMSVGVGAR